MTQTPLPEAFKRRIAAQLGEAAQAYFAALGCLPVRGLRMNPHKTPNAPIPTLVEGLGEPVPWADHAYLLAADSAAGAHPLHEAGAYYLQEPSAMLPATLLKAQPGETVLDLCAAPGGKSTQIAAAMANAGTLVCNEPVPSRAQVLSRNLERMGVQNALVVSADPSQLALAWPQLFDAVLVDAPCSGEGMFRRHPEARLEWDADAPARCAARQARILDCAYALLKPGGRLCYATCTFSREENEDTVAAFVARYPTMTLRPFTVPLGDGRVLDAPAGQVRLYPHLVAGEGHFTALMQKEPDSQPLPRASRLRQASQALAAPEPTALSAYCAFRAQVAAAALPAANAALGGMLLCAPPLPPLQGIRVLRAGLVLGQLKGKTFVPDHALAMAAPHYALPTYSLAEHEARTYQRGEALPVPDRLRGYAAVTLHGLALGFGKASDGWIKNHYPKGLRRP